MIEGRLSYNLAEDRYGLLVMDSWYCSGFHCGDCLEVFIDGVWLLCRFEIDGDLWYLAGAPFLGPSFESIEARV